MPAPDVIKIIDESCALADDPVPFKEGGVLEGLKSEFVDPGACDPQPEVDQLVKEATGGSAVNNEG